MTSDNTEKKLINAIVTCLRTVNRAAKHYFVNPPETDSSGIVTCKFWRAGWVDNPASPKVTYFEQAEDPQHLIALIEQASKK